MFIPDEFRISNELWREIEKLLPVHLITKKGGRPRRNDRQIMEGLLYLLRTGCQWAEIPSKYGPKSTVYDRFREWQGADVFFKLWVNGLVRYDNKIGIDWKWISGDGSMTKAPLGGQATGPNPTDRAKKGTKRSILTDANGIPISIVVSGANRHDKILLPENLKSIVVPRPKPTKKNKQHLLLDKGYDYPDIRDLVNTYQYVAHIKSRGEETNLKKHVPGFRARRWVVERTHSWINRFRRLLIRWEKLVSRYLAFVYLAFAIIVYRFAGVSG
jgi:putative transposase